MNILQFHAIKLEEAKLPKIRDILCHIEYLKRCPSKHNEPLNIIFDKKTEDLMKIWNQSQISSKQQIKLSISNSHKSLSSLRKRNKSHPTASILIFANANL